jgi:hypothetical protein
MKRSRVSFALLAFAIVPLSVQAQRTYVSAQHGSDSNPCSVTSPCRTFGAAIAAVAAGGEVIVLDSGGYGAVTVTKSVTLEAPAGIYAGIRVTSGDALFINASSSDTVVLRGLVLAGGPNAGIRTFTVGTLQVESCVVSGFVYGIYLNAPASYISVKDTIVRQNTDGLLVSFGSRASVDHCRFEQNLDSGVYVDDADVSVRDSVSAGNKSHGFVSTAINSENSILNVYQCMATNNGLDGLYAFNSGTGFVIARAADSAFSDNLGHGLNSDSTGGGTLTFESLGNNFVRGNIGGDISGTITLVSLR